MSDSFLEQNPNSELARKESGGLPAAVILAGGLGTRLRAAYSTGPKCMALVGGRPFLNYLLTWLRSQGVKEVILCVGYKRTHIQKYVGKGRKWGLRVTYSIEKELLGTGGAVKKAEWLVSGKRLFVVNGDTFLGVNLSELFKFHVSRGALATLAVVNVADDRRYGSLRLDHEGKITAFLEKGEGDSDHKSNGTTKSINGGVYIFEKKLLNHIRTPGPVSLEKNVFPQIVARKNKKVYGLLTDAYFVDIGVPKDLWRAQRELPERFHVNDSH
ncbi:MAG: nucleotidyltransferase family protein [Candidatus Acidiferrales bacterium]